MGTYNLGAEEIEEGFEKWIQEESAGKGDISASTIAEAWNRIAKKHKWDDTLIARFKKW